MNLEPILAPIRGFANSGITVNHFIALSMILFLIGIYGILTRRNIVAILMSVEILLNAAMINFVAAAAFSADRSITGSVFALFIVAIAAAEVAVGLAIFINVFRSKGGVTTEDLMEMRN